MKENERLSRKFLSKEYHNLGARQREKVSRADVACSCCGVCIAVGR
jgi:hypothetical protein